LSRVLKLVAPLPTASGDGARAGAFVGDDAELIAAFRLGDRKARAALYDRHAEHVHRVLYRIVGLHADLADLHHDVFVRALSSLPTLQDPSAFKGWLTMIAVHAARTWITRKKRLKWLWFLPQEELPDPPSHAASGEVLRALMVTYAVLDTLPVDERIAFALRFIDQMELTEVARACDTSLATIKRRLDRACERFEAEARRQPVLESWLEGGSRWGNPSDP
jgi:RNA polymerase sigma-70 factor (ECF subfamily)